jgi:hypothetical protein
MARGHPVGGGVPAPFRALEGDGECLRAVLDARPCTRGRWSKSLADSYLTTAGHESHRYSFREVKRLDSKLPSGGLMRALPGIGRSPLTSGHPDQSMVATCDREPAPLSMAQSQELLLAVHMESL